MGRGCSFQTNGFHVNIVNNNCEPKASFQLPFKFWFKIALMTKLVLKKEKIYRNEKHQLNKNRMCDGDERRRRFSHYSRLYC